MPNKIIESLITKQIACAYVIYKNDRIANDMEDDIISFEMYAEIFALGLKCHMNEITEILQEVDKRLAEEKRIAKMEKKRGKK